MHIVVVANNRIINPRRRERAMEDSLQRMENAVRPWKIIIGFEPAKKGQPIEADVEID